MSPNGNATLLRALVMYADEIALSASREKFPILLRKLAERRRITSVEFRPLLVDAVLITHAYGFRILFNSGRSDPQELETRYYGESPQQLADARIRFSLAHEFAHTLFYDLTLRPPRIAKRFRGGGGKTALENLERNCDRLAGRLLLPTSLFEAAILNMKEISPHLLRDFARCAGVSVEVVIRRLGTRSECLRRRFFFGCIAIVKHDPKGRRVRAVSIPQHLDLARDLQLIRPGEEWQVTNSEGAEINLADFSGVTEISLLGSASQRGRPTPYRMQVITLNRFDSEATYLVVLEQVHNL